MKNNVLIIGAIGLLLLGNSCIKRNVSPLTEAPKKMKRIYGFAIQKHTSSREDKIIKHLKLNALANYVHQADTFQHTTDVFLPPFDSIRFNKAIAYDYPGEDHYWSVLNEYQAFIPTISTQKILNWQQTKHFIEVITDSSTYGESPMKCFSPHFGVVFYNHDTPVVTIDVCLNCNSLASTKKIPVMYPQTGFSSEGIEKIRRFCRQR
jgi:hypothetical protein